MSIGQHLCERIERFVSTSSPNKQQVSLLDDMVQSEAKAIGLEGWDKGHATIDVLRRGLTFEERLKEATSSWLSKETDGVFSFDEDDTPKLVKWAYESLSGLIPRHEAKSDTVGASRLLEFLSLEVRTEHQELRDEIISAAFDTTA